MLFSILASVIQVLVFLILGSLIHHWEQVSILHHQKQVS